VCTIHSTQEERGTKLPAALATEHRPRPVSITDGSEPMGFSSWPEPHPLWMSMGRGGISGRGGGFSVTLLARPAAKVASNPTLPCCWLARHSSTGTSVPVPRPGDVDHKRSRANLIHSTFRHPATGGIVAWPRVRDGPWSFAFYMAYPCPAASRQRHGHIMKSVLFMS
jgi:hypothetical protein